MNVYFLCVFHTAPAIAEVGGKKQETNNEIRQFDVRSGKWEKGTKLQTTGSHYNVCAVCAVRTQILATL